MKKQAVYRRAGVKYLAYLLAAALAGACLFGAVLARADGTTGNEAGMPAWANPKVMAVRRVSAADTSQHQSNLLANLDCILVDYRLVSGNTSQTGCFTETAYGLVDSDSDTVIFNGTDEGLPLLPYSAHEVLIPWPRAADLVALDAAPTGGSYISLYKDALGSIKDERNLLLQLVAKQLTAPPELPLKDAAGRQLVINPASLAFSDNGSWLVAETLNGSFVRINLATLDMTAFAPAFGSQGSPALLKSQVTISSDGRYVAIANDAASSLKVYDLAGCGGVGVQVQGCGSYEYLPFVRTQIAGLQSIRHLRFINDGLLSLEAQSSNPDNDGVYELAPQGSITSLIDYLGLGDSYTSGEGAFDYLSGTDTADDMCHLSANSYPLLLTHDLFGNAGGHSVACSGAVINDVGNTSSGYRGQVRGVAPLGQLQQSQSALLDSIMTNYLPGYVAQQQFVKQYQPAVTSVSVGGDDIGFGDIVENCVVPHVSLHISDSTCYDTYEDRLEVTSLIDRTVPRWTALYKQLKAEAPGTRLYAIGYPEVVADTGNCALNAHLGKGELEFSEELIDYLNGAIRQAAGKAGVSYVDISQALAGHRLCETSSYDVAVNGLTAGTDGKVLGVRVFGKESYHPNALGQALIEQAILKQTHNLTAVPPVSTASGSQDILKAPKTGRAVAVKVPDDGLAPKVIKVSNSAALQASGSQDGLKPNTVYTVRLDGPTGPVIGTVSSGGNGDIASAVELPGGTAPGGHTIDVTGDNQADQPIDITQPIYVPVSDNDTDGDGLPDDTDSCPAAVNSGQDEDQDGVDDTCDGFIGQPPDNGAQPGPSGVPDSGQGGGSGSPASSTPVSTGLILPDQSVSIVKVFPVSVTQTTISAAAGQGSSHTARAALALGTTTISPAAVKALKPPAALSTGRSGPIASLRVINWPVWIALPVILWLVVLLVLYAWRFAKRPAPAEQA